MRGDSLRRVDRDSREWEGIDRGPAQRKAAKELREARRQGVSPPMDLRCSEHDDEPNVVRDAHHRHPLYLGGEDERWNLCGVENKAHEYGHKALDDQSEFAEEYARCGVLQTSLRLHAEGQEYQIVAWDGFW
jgi:hypothetical protein